MIMTQIGTLASVWRFPVKSMAGEEVERLFCSYAGFMGDRAYAFEDLAEPPRFPWLTARKHEPYLLYRPRYRDVAATLTPPHVEPAEKTPGATSIYPPEEAFAIDVTTPSGERFALNSPELLAHLEAASGRRLALRHSAKGLADCAPVSLMARQTLDGFSALYGAPLDQRRFRMNLMFDWDRAVFAEDALIGKRLRIGDRLELAVIDTDARCKMITIDPDSAAAEPKIMRALAQAHGGALGVYATVLREGVARRGDAITLLVG